MQSEASKVRIAWDTAGLPSPVLSAIVSSRTLISMTTSSLQKIWTAFALSYRYNITRLSARPRKATTRAGTWKTEWFGQKACVLICSSLSCCLLKLSTASFTIRPSESNTQQQALSLLTCCLHSLSPSGHQQHQTKANSHYQLPTKDPQLKPTKPVLCP